MVAGSGGLMLLLVTAIGGVFRLVVMRRLQRFETTARLIAAGDLERRVPVNGSDTLAWLGQEFNAMADSMTGLLGEVRNQREQLETVINSIDDGIVVLDPERKVIAANDAFLRRTGQRRGRGARLLLPSTRPGHVRLERLPDPGLPATGERQIRICERTGPERGDRLGGGALLADPRSLPARSSRWWRCGGTSPERRAAEAQLAESHRLASLGLLASGFSHELNTPLATVLACVEGILRDAQAGRRRPSDGGMELASARTPRSPGSSSCAAAGSPSTSFASPAARGRRPTWWMSATTLDAVVRLIAPTARDHSVTIEVEPVAGRAPRPGRTKRSCSTCCSTCC